MHNLLSKLLDKRKVKIDDLSKEEKLDFDRWERILSSGEITLDKIKLFATGQIGTIEANWKNLDNTKEKNEKLITMHCVYKALLESMTANETERETLEKYLIDLI